MVATRSVTRQRTLERRAAIERSILDAVAELLAERSFRDVTVEEVMTVAGLTRTAFYRYFPDLEAVLLRLMAEVADALGDASSTWLESDDDEADVLFDAGKKLAAVYAERGRLLLAFTDAAGSGLDIESAWREAVEQFVADSSERIGRLRDAGVAKVENSVETSRALVWMTERYLLEVFGHRSGGNVTIDEATNVLVTIWRRTLFSPI